MANPFAECPKCHEQIHIKEIVLHYKGCVRRFFKQQRVKYDKKRICETCGEELTSKRYKGHLMAHLRKQGGNSIG